jgi:hypothetical protein
MLIVGFLIHWGLGWKVMVENALATSKNREASGTLPTSNKNSRNEANSANSRNSQQNQAHKTDRHTDKQPGSLSIIHLHSACKPSLCSQILT